MRGRTGAPDRRCADTHRMFHARVLSLAVAQPARRPARRPLVGVRAVVRGVYSLPKKIRRADALSPAPASSA